MSQVVASFRSVEAELTSVQLSSQRQSLAVRVGGGEKPNLLNKQQNDIVDGVDLSQEAVQKLEEAQALARQLAEYLDYLKDRGSNPLARITAPDENPDAVIAGRSTNLAASITAGKITEKTLEISADFDDEGNLSELTITKTQASVEFVRADFILEDRQFYAAIS